MFVLILALTNTNPTDTEEVHIDWTGARTNDHSFHHNANLGASAVASTYSHHTWPTARISQPVSRLSGTLVAMQYNTL